MRPGGKPSFRELFCEEFGCSDRDFEKKIFWMGLFPVARPLAFLISIFRPSYFDLDFGALKSLGNLREEASCRHQAEGFKGNYRGFGSHTALRRRLLVRVSGRRLLQINDRVWKRRSSS